MSSDEPRLTVPTVRRMKLSNFVRFAIAVPRELSTVQKQNRKQERRLPAG